MATLGMSEQEREAVEAFRRDVVEPSMTNLIILDFWAEWCGPCKMMAPQFEAAARSLEPQFRLGKLDTEAEQQITDRYGIRGIPTMILFRGGKEIARTSGVMPAAQIAQWARSHV